MSLWWCVLCVIHASAVLAAAESFGDVFDDSALDGNLEKISGFWYQIAELRTRGNHSIVCKDIIMEEHHIIHLDKICEETGSYQLATTENGNFVIHETGHVINLKTTKDLSFLGTYRQTNFNSADYIKIYGRTPDKSRHFNQLTKRLAEFRVVTCTQKRTGDCLSKIRQQTTQFKNEETSSYHIKKRLRVQRQPRSSEKEKPLKKEQTELNDYAIQKINGTDYIAYDDVLIPLESDDNKEGENQLNKTENVSTPCNSITKTEATHVDGKELGDDPNNQSLNNTNSSMSEISKLNSSVNAVENLVLNKTVNNVTQRLTPSANVTKIPNEQYNEMFSNTSSGRFNNSFISITVGNFNINQTTNYDAINVTTEKTPTTDDVAVSAIKEETPPGLKDNTLNWTISSNQEANEVSSSRTDFSSIKNDNNSDIGFTDVENTIVYTNIVTPYQKVSDSELNNSSLRTPSPFGDKNSVSLRNTTTPGQSSYWNEINNTTPVQETDYNYTNYIQENETESTPNSSPENELKWTEWTTSSNESISSGITSLPPSNLSYVTENSVPRNSTSADGIDGLWKSSSTTDSVTSSNHKNLLYLSSLSSINFTKIFTPSPNPFNTSTEDLFQSNRSTTAITHQGNDNNTTQSNFIPFGDTSSLFTTTSGNSSQNTTHPNTTSVTPAVTDNLFTFTTTDQSNITANVTAVTNTQISNQSSTESLIFTAQNITVYVTNTTDNITSPQNFNTSTTAVIPVTAFNTSTFPITSNVTTPTVRPVKPNITNISTTKPGNRKSNSSMPNSRSGSYFILVSLIINFLLTTCIW